MTNKAKQVFCADIGTTSLKTALVDENGAVVSFSQQFFSERLSHSIGDSNTIETGNDRHDGKMALHWLSALHDAWHEIRGASSCDTPDAICISGNGPTVVAKDGRAFLWNEKITSSLACDLMSGNSPVAASLFLPRIVDFLEKYPDLVSSQQYIFSGPEFLVHALTGKAVTVLPEARYRSAYWTEEQLSTLTKNLRSLSSYGSLSFDKLLPHYIAPSTCAGFTTVEINESFGFAHGVPVFCCGPDFVAAMIGTNSLAAGKIYDRAGSSEGLNLCSPVAEKFDEMRLMPSINSSLWNISALGNDVHDVNKFSCMVERINFVQQKLGLKNAHFISVTGGQAKNEKWMQQKCDVAKIPLAMCNCADAELIGDAIVALTGLGVFDSIESAADAVVKITKLYTPR